MKGKSLRLWKDREKMQLDPRLFSDTAEEWAKKIAKEAKEGKKEKNKNSQLRRYFDEIVRLNTAAQHGGEENMKYKVLPQIHMIIAKVVYARGRDLVTDSFVNMMRDGINAIENKADLQVFKNFLESFMGFYKVYGPKQ